MVNHLDSKMVRSKIEQIDTLPTIPGVLKKLLKILDSPSVSLSDISQFISNDPALAAKVLRMVNSPIYGFPGRISSVTQAVILLGINVVKGLLLGVSVFELMQKAMVGLWEHSFGCAITARLIAKKMGMKEPEELSAAGLLHDIGKVILILYFNSIYEGIMKEAEEQGITVLEAERNTIFLTHANAGAWMTQRWSFPRNLIEIIEYHHKPHLSKNVPLETSIIHVSDIIVRARGFGFAGDNLVPMLNKEAWEFLALTEANLRDIFSELEDSIEGATGMFTDQ